MDLKPTSPDQLNQVGVLVRREIEARLLIPLLQSLSEQFGREQVHQVVQETIQSIAREQGAELASSRGNTLIDFADALDAWKKDDAMQIQTLEHTDQCYAFNVTRCRYAEMYAALGAPGLGTLLSCNRDAALIEGFNPLIHLTRTQTIMEGDALCDFRYQLKNAADFA